MYYLSDLAKNNSLFMVGQSEHRSESLPPDMTSDVMGHMTQKNYFNLPLKKVPNIYMLSWQSCIAYLCNDGAMIDISWK